MSNPLCILDEDRMDLQKASDFLHQSMATTRRMVNVGAETPTGTRVFLEHLHIGLKIVTSRQAIERYLAAINGISLEVQAVGPPSPSQTKQRQRELERVDRELAAAGL